MAEEEVRDYVHQILLGVQYMHENNIVHLDLKVRIYYFGFYLTINFLLIFKSNFGNIF